MSMDGAILFGISTSSDQTETVLTTLSQDVAKMYSEKCQSTATAVYTYAFPAGNEVEITLERIWSGQTMASGVEAPMPGSPTNMPGSPTNTPGSPTINMTGSATIKMSQRDHVLEERITAAIHLPAYANLPTSGHHPIVRRIIIVGQ